MASRSASQATPQPPRASHRKKAAAEAAALSGERRSFCRGKCCALSAEITPRFVGLVANPPSVSGVPLALLRRTVRIARPRSARWRQRCEAAALGTLFDRDVDEVAPLRPRAVVVLDRFVAQQLSEDEPGVSAALADPAVRRHLFFRRYALALVELAELVCALEGPVVADGRRPGNRRRGRDVARTLRALLLVAGRGDQVAGVLPRTADVDERLR